MAARLNGNLKYAGLIISMLTIFAAIVVGYTKTVERQEALCHRLDALSKDGSDLARANERAIIEMKGDVKYIKVAVDKISDKIDGNP